MSILVITTTAQAGLGWSLAECVQHFGNPIPTELSPYAGRTKYEFLTKDWQILVYILNSKVSRIGYMTANNLDIGLINDLLWPMHPQKSNGLVL